MAFKVEFIFGKTLVNLAAPLLLVSHCRGMWKDHSHTHPVCNCHVLSAVHAQTGKRDYFYYFLFFLNLSKLSSTNKHLKPLHCHLWCALWFAAFSFFPLEEIVCKVHYTVRLHNLDKTRLVHQAHDASACLTLSIRATGFAQMQDGKTLRARLKHNVQRNFKVVF